MDKVFSTRLDENLIKKVDRFIKARSITKKSLVEKSLRTFLKEAESNIDRGIIDKSFGAWKRDETINETWRRGRSAFNRGYKRYSQDKDLS